MPSKPAANLKRFKNGPAGMRDFAMLIEQSDPQSREMILASAAEEDARFVEQAMRKVVFFEELTLVEETIITEIIAKISPKVLAFALQDMPKEFIETLTKHLGLRERRMLLDEQSNLSRKLSESFVLGAQKQILKTARAMEANNVFIFELTDCPRFKKKKKKVG
jgi:flagellar motor switch protein FliG